MSYILQVGEQWAIRSPGSVIVSAASLGLRRVYESLMLQVAIPDASERLNVPHFSRSDVHLAAIARTSAIRFALVTLNPPGSLPRRSGFAQHEIDHPAAPHVFASRPAVGEDFGVVAAGFLKTGARCHRAGTSRMPTSETDAVPLANRIILRYQRLIPFIFLYGTSSLHSACNTERAPAWAR
jgi:hypothetical protein